MPCFPAFFGSLPLSSGPLLACTNTCNGLDQNKEAERKEAKKQKQQTKKQKNKKTKTKAKAKRKKHNNKKKKKTPQNKLFNTHVQRNHHAVQSAGRPRGSAWCVLLSTQLLNELEHLANTEGQALVADGEAAHARVVLECLHANRLLALDARNAHLTLFMKTQHMSRGEGTR